MIATTLRPLQLLLWLSVASIVCNAQEPPRCYLPNGNHNPEGFACNTTAVEAGKHSPCCYAGDTCLSSGVCHQPLSGNMYRLSCTDRQWKDPACPQFCVNKVTGDHNVGRGIQACGVVGAGEPGRACCLPGNEPCCKDTAPAALFDLAPGTPVAILDTAGINMMVMKADVRVASTQISQAPTPAPSDSTSNPTIATNPSVPAEQHQSEMARLQQITLGVGVGLSLLMGLALAAVVFIAVKYRAMRRQYEEYVDGHRCDLIPPVQRPRGDTGHELYGDSPSEMSMVEPRYPASGYGVGS